MPDPTTELFALDPEEFVVARDDLARRLRRAGDPAAADVTRLRRPTVPVWLLNLVARDEPDLVARARDVGSRLRAAHAAALTGKGASELRDLAARRRSVVAEVVDAAVRAADARGREVSPAHRDSVAATVEAALADDSLAREWADGRLRGVQSPSGFNFGDAAPAGGSRPARRVTSATPEPVQPARSAAGEGERDPDHQAKAAADKAATLRAAADDARAEVERRRQSWVEADRAAKAARQALREAERAASRADLFAATAEQAAWESGERARR